MPDFPHSRSHCGQCTDAQKVYYSGPLVRCNERTADGQRASRDADWHDVWAQLGGTSLSVWDMKAIDEANKRGAQAPPSYINVTDAVSSTVQLYFLLSSKNSRSQLLVPSTSAKCYNVWRR